MSLFEVDRSACAEAVMRGGRMVPCGAPAECRSPADSERPWAYCPAHARFVVLVLEVLAEEEPRSGEVWRRIRAEEMRAALEVV